MCSSGEERSKRPKQYISSNRRSNSMCFCPRHSDLRLARCGAVGPCKRDRAAPGGTQIRLAERRCFVRVCCIVCVSVCVCVYVSMFPSLSLFLPLCICIGLSVVLHLCLSLFMITSVSLSLPLYFTFPFPFHPLLAYLNAFTTY